MSEEDSHSTTIDRVETGQALQPARLLILTGPQMGTELIIPARGGGIGRGHWNVIQLTDPEISRSHCVIEIQGGKQVIVDIGSRSGTRVNGKIISRHVLQDEDELTLGATSLRYLGPSATAYLSLTHPSYLAPAGSDVLAGRYEILGMVGMGGMGSVYRVHDRVLDEVVALKTLRRELADSEEMLEQFRREVKLARRVTHKNVARIFDISEHDGEKFLTMELVEGESLSAMLARQSILAFPVAVEIALELCEGLSAAHEAGVVHRDLKPDNVLIAVDGRVVITDFGIAFDPSAPGWAAGSMIAGTPMYMAPELVRGSSSSDARVDVYSLGSVLFEMVTGRPPWTGKNQVEIATQRLFSPPPDARAVNADVPQGLARVILRCMAIKPADRYPSAERVAADLRGALFLLREHPAPAPVPGAWTDRNRSQEFAIRTERDIAVLRFRNPGSPDDDYLTEELTNEVIDALAMTSGLRVCPYSRVKAHAWTDSDLRAIGDKLGVQIVAAGTVERRHGSICIEARLVNVVDGFQLWAERFEGRPRDLLAISDQAVRAIATALTLSTSAPARRSMDPIAIDLYLRGRNEYRRFWADSTRRAIELFEQARARAPEDPSILAGCAMAHARQIFFAGNDSAAAELADKAVKLAPNHAEARLALAMVRYQTNDTAAALREVCRAVALLPSLADAHLLLGRILLEVGPITKAMQSLEHALALDPALYVGYRELSRAQILAGGSLDRARAELDRMPSTVDARVMRTVEDARLALWARSTADAGEVLRTIASADLPDGLPMQISRAIAGLVLDPTCAFSLPEPLLESSQQSTRRQMFFWQIMAETAAYRDRPDEVLHAVAQAVANGLIDINWLDHCPLLAAYRAHEHFGKLRQQVFERARVILDAWDAR